nr:hypothetical protein [Deltaproteobacteria bacterium]
MCDPGRTAAAPASSVRGDRASCGACAWACAAGQASCAGRLRRGCCGGLTNCSGACVDLTGNSGELRRLRLNACTGGSRCVTGYRQVPRRAQTRCGAVCVNNQTTRPTAAPCGHAAAQARCAPTGAARRAQTSAAGP